MPTTAGNDPPRVLLVSLDVSSAFDHIYGQLLRKLNGASTVDRAAKPDSALLAQGLTDQPPQTVLVTDGGIAQHRDVYGKLLEYVRGGGVLVLMGTFSSYTSPDDMNKLFQEAGLPWKTADYHRTTVYRNNNEETSRASLPSSYSQKAVFLAGVVSKDAWYLPSDSSRTESFVFPSQPIQDLMQTPIAFTNIGKGKLGYVGDVNGEQESDAVVLAMCGLST